MSVFRSSLSHPLVRASLGSAFAIGLAMSACDSNPEARGGDGDAGDGDGDGDTGDGDIGDGDIGDGDGDFNLGGNMGVGGAGDGDGDGPVCETSSSEAELAPIFLSFALDVSGSMGGLDKPNWWHDPNLKWNPVREVTQDFFEAADSEGISASLTFFPANSDLCDEESYAEPDVVMTALPSTLFAGALDDYEAETESEGWRSGTPTLPAFAGTSPYLSSFQAANTDAKFAMVLVTDGIPSGCGDDSIASLEAAVGALYDGGDGIRTYVIGIENPTVPPDQVPDDWGDWGSQDVGENCGHGPGTGAGDGEPCVPPNALATLNSVAAAGGTEHAHLIDTNDPMATRAAFRAAIDLIRTEAISCELGIPPHPSGGTFDADKIDVSYALDGESTRFDYDAECEVEGAWHYDNEESPTMIVLCPETCDFIQMTPGAELNVDFLCEDRPAVVK